jgi:hypothetical protein
LKQAVTSAVDLCRFRVFDATAPLRSGITFAISVNVRPAQRCSGLVVFHPNHRSGIDATCGLIYHFLRDVELPRHILVDACNELTIAACCWSGILAVTINVVDVLPHCDHRKSVFVCLQTPE